MYRDQIKEAVSGLNELVDMCDKYERKHNGVKKIEDENWVFTLEHSHRLISYGRGESKKKNAVFDRHFQKASDEVIICLSGKIKIVYFLADREEEVLLTRNNASVFIQKGVEHKIIGVNKGCKLMYIQFPTDVGLIKLFGQDDE